MAASMLAIHVRIVLGVSSDAMARELTTVLSMNGMNYDWYSLKLPAAGLDIIYVFFALDDHEDFASARSCVWWFTGGNHWWCLAGSLILQAIRTMLPPEP